MSCNKIVTSLSLVRCPEIFLIALTLFFLGEFRRETL